MTAALRRPFLSPAGFLRLSREIEARDPAADLVGLDAAWWPVSQPLLDEDTRSDALAFIAASAQGGRP